MTRDEIYDHLAQVYLGKKNKVAEKKKQDNNWLIVNVLITVIIFGSAIYGLAAFFSHHEISLNNKIVYALNKGPIRINYDLNYPYPPTKSFMMQIPDISVDKYKELQFSIRGLEEGFPDIIRLEVRNKRNEISSVFIEDIQMDWKSFTVSFEEFKQITDWTNVTEISFVIEAWNIGKKKGIILVDNICFLR